MLDPEQLTFAQWFWIVLAMVVAIMFVCRCIGLTDSEEPIPNERMEAPQSPPNPVAPQGAGSGQGQGR